MPSRPPKEYSDAVAFPRTVELRAIGVVRSPYTERYMTPRQAPLVGMGREGADEPARIEFFEDIVSADAIADLAGFDRIWVISWMHLNTQRREFPARVRTPRGGPKRSIFATRAPHRPNPLALSAVRLERVEGTVLHVLGIDLIDGTPVLDVKPYVPYADAFPDAESGWTGGVAPVFPRD